MHLSKFGSKTQSSKTFFQIIVTYNGYAVIVQYEWHLWSLIWYAQSEFGWVLRLSGWVNTFTKYVLQGDRKSSKSKFLPFLQNLFFKFKYGWA